MRYMIGGRSPHVPLNSYGRCCSCVPLLGQVRHLTPSRAQTSQSPSPRGEARNDHKTPSSAVHRALAAAAAADASPSSSNGSPASSNPHTPREPSGPLPATRPRPPGIDGALSGGGALHRPARPVHEPSSSAVPSPSFGRVAAVAPPSILTHFRSNSLTGFDPSGGAAAVSEGQKRKQGHFQAIRVF